MTKMQIISVILDQYNYLMRMGCYSVCEVVPCNMTVKSLMTKTKAELLKIEDDILEVGCNTIF